MPELLECVSEFCGLSNEPCEDERGDSESSEEITMAPDAPLRSEPEAVADIGSREKLSFGGDGICAGSIRGEGSLLGRLFVMVIPPRLGDRSESWPESETIDLLTRIPCGGRPVERAPAHQLALEDRTWGLHEAVAQRVVAVATSLDSSSLWMKRSALVISAMADVFASS